MNVVREIAACKLHADEGGLRVYEWLGSTNIFELTRDGMQAILFLGRPCRVRGTRGPGDSYHAAMDLTAICGRASICACEGRENVVGAAACEHVR
jgi:hypothetical protein